MRRFHYAIGVVVILLAAPLTRARDLPDVEKPGPASTQTAAPLGTGLLMGQVVDAAGKPVSGAVLTLSGGYPMVGGRLLPSAMAGGARRVLTDAQGRFVFFDLPKGSFSIEATKVTYLPGAYGRQRFGGPAQSIDLGEGERRSSIRIQMWEFGAITGTILDETGEPVVGAQVSALPRVYEAGHARLSTTPVQSDRTDDRGVYRIESLPPGQYVVAVVAAQQFSLPASTVDAYAADREAGRQTEGSLRQATPSGQTALVSFSLPGARIGDAVLQNLNRGLYGATAPLPVGGRSSAYPTIFYPSAQSSKSAETLTIKSGEERPAVNLRLLLVPAGSIAGSVIGPDGPVANLPIRLVPDYVDDLTAETLLEVQTAATDAQGRFTFLSVPAGRYIVRAMKSSMSANSLDGPPKLQADPTLWADTPVAVDDRGVADLRVTLTRGFRVSGRLEFEGTRARPAPEVIAGATIVLDRADGHATSRSVIFTGFITGTGEISTNEIPPGRYLIQFVPRPAIPGWDLKSATVEGRDVSSVPLDLRADTPGLVLTVTDHASEVTGFARDASGRPNPGATVLLITTDTAAWVDFGSASRRLREIRASEDGSYQFRGVPAGSYFVIAIPDEDAAVWQSVERLRAIIRSATRVTIADGEKKTLDLPTTPIR